MSYTGTKTSHRKVKSSYFTTTISIFLVLLLLGIVGLLALTAKKLSIYVKENIEISVFIHDDVKEVDIKRLEKFLNATEYVKSTSYISKEKAASIFREDFGEDFEEFLGYNPLNASIEIKLFSPFANPDSIAIIENELSHTPHVKEVAYQKELIHLVNENVKRISLVILAFCLILIVISVALINNTIRLNIYSKRFIINTMQLVGATRGFIRRPFIVRSLIQGMIGGLVAIGTLILIVLSIQKNIREVISIQDLDTLAILFLVVLSAGLLLSGLSTYFSVNRFLNLRTDELYH